MSYPSDLSAAWRAAKAPRAVVSLFAGCGGSSLGYAMAGYRELLAVEWEDHAAETFRLNFPRVPLHHGDVLKLSGEDALARAGIRQGELDVLDGSPPCQGFSMAGVRRKRRDDPRNQLYLEYIRLLKAFRPRAMIMENVTGLARGRMRGVLRSILRDMDGAGYRVEARILNALWYGVPQDRQRIIFVGTRKDLPIAPAFPQPTATVPLSFRDAVLGVDSVGAPLRGLMASAYDVTKPGESYADGIVRMGGRDSYYSVYRLAWEKPCRTIVKTLSLGFNGLAHPSERASISLAALKRCASFPDQFRLPGDQDARRDFERQWARVGNSVPPLMMRAVARRVRQILEEKEIPLQPRKKAV